MLNDDSGKPVHFPANPDVFQFDAEVSLIFPDMALRSIPNFWAAHQAHARMVTPFLNRETSPRVLDIGTSRGHFVSALRRAGYKGNIMAMDNSGPMLDLFHEEHGSDPNIGVRHMDITQLAFDEYVTNNAGTFDVVCVNYVLQFLPRGDQYRVLRLITKLLKKNGFLILGHKEDHKPHGELGTLGHEEYINFRVANGYSREEIEAKTKALKGSMHPMNGRSLVEVLYHDFPYVMETFRFMMFASLIARKG